jgi:hypothetical protein
VATLFWLYAGLTQMSISNQDYELDTWGRCTVTLADGRRFFFEERPVKLYCAKSAEDVRGIYEDDHQFVLRGPPDDDGLWHVLVLEVDDYGQVPLLIAQLTTEEADDMREKIKIVTDAFLAGWVRRTR